jgi:hypothetical protein
MDGVWIAPVTAQLMMTLPFAMKSLPYLWDGTPREADVASSSAA